MPLGYEVGALRHAYRSGVYSSRRIPWVRGRDFGAMTVLSQPDFRTISEFRRRHVNLTKLIA